MCIAIVDDLATDRTILQKQLRAELKARNIKIDIKEYNSGEAFKAEFVPGFFTVVFLDIYMGLISGMDVAKLLYQQDPKCKIVFLTTSEEFMLQSYSVRATYYLVKPFALDRLRQALDFCFPQLDPADKLTVRIKTGMVLLERQDILYIESIARHGCICLGDRVIESVDGFVQVTAPLKGDTRFLHCGRGVLIHMNYVTAQAGSDFVMADGRRFAIPRRIRKEVVRVFQDFFLKTMREGNR